MVRCPMTQLLVSLFLCINIALSLSITTRGTEMIAKKSFMAFSGRGRTSNSLRSFPPRRRRAALCSSSGDSDPSWFAARPPPEPVLISSLKSNTVKKWQALLQKRKKRTEWNATVIEGPRMVFDLLANPKTTTLVEKVLISQSMAANKEYSPRALQQEHPHVQVCLGTDEIVSACSDTVTPQGIVATIAIPPAPSKTEPPLSADRNKKRQPLCLVLDGVSDPGNVGTLLRSSVAVGVAAIILLPRCCDVWNPKAVRSAMGCSFQVPILSVDSFQECQTVLNSWGIQNVFAATMVDKSDDQNGLEDDSTPPPPSVEHYQVDWIASPTALVIGSEGTGLSDVVRDAVISKSIRAVHVPMETGVESLNAAVCGSVILFEYLRQCRTQQPQAASSC